MTGLYIFAVTPYVVIAILLVLKHRENMKRDKLIKDIKNLRKVL